MFLNPFFILEQFSPLIFVAILSAFVFILTFCRTKSNKSNASEYNASNACRL